MCTGWPLAASHDGLAVVAPRGDQLAIAAERAVDDRRRMPSGHRGRRAVQDVEDRDRAVAPPGDQPATTLVDGDSRRGTGSSSTTTPVAATGRGPLHPKGRPRGARDRGTGSRRTGRGTGGRTATDPAEAGLAEAPGRSRLLQLDLPRVVDGRPGSSIVREGEPAHAPRDRDGCDLLFPGRDVEPGAESRGSPADRDLVSTGKKPYPSAFTVRTTSPVRASRKATSPTLFVTPSSSPSSETPTGPNSLPGSGRSNRIASGARTSAASSPDSVSADSSSSTAWRARRRERSMSSASCASALSAEPSPPSPSPSRFHVRRGRVPRRSRRGRATRRRRRAARNRWFARRWRAARARSRPGSPPGTPAQLVQLLLPAGRPVERGGQAGCRVELRMSRPVIPRRRCVSRCSRSSGPGRPR